MIIPNPAQPALPPAAFVDPSGANRAAAEALGAEVVRLVVELLSTASSRPPLPPPAELAELARIPDGAATPGELLGGLRALLEGSMNPANPGYIGHMDSMPAWASVLGEMAAAAVNNNLLSVEMSPALSGLERLLTRDFAQRFGLGPGSGGVLASGGTLANLQALAVARNRRFDALDAGIAELGARPVLFASEAAHTSLQKSASLLGLGTRGVVPVAAGAHGRMDVERLRAAIGAARGAGQLPFAVVATAGTTVTGSIDPLHAIADVARAEDLWLHVDAAYGGALVFSERERGRLAGVERADSVTFNPQKWLYVAKTSAMVLFRDLRVLEDAFQVAAPYMRGGGEVNLGEISVQGTRHAEVLKLWMALRHVGARGFGALVDAGMDLAARIREEVRQRPFLELAAAPDTNLVCFRGGPRDAPPVVRDDWNGRLQASLLAEEGIFVSLPVFRGARWLRIVPLNPYTDERVVQRLFRRIDAHAELGG